MASELELPGTLLEDDEDGLLSSELGEGGGAKGRSVWGRDVDVISPKWGARKPDEEEGEEVEETAEVIHATVDKSKNKKGITAGIAESGKSERIYVCLDFKKHMFSDELGAKGKIGRIFRRQGGYKYFLLRKGKKEKKGN